MTKLYVRSKPLLPGWFAAMVSILLFSSTGMASSRSLQAIQLSNIEQNQGKPFYIVDNFPVLNRANMQWALSTYLMAKGHYCNVFISTTQNYGIDAWHSEYSAQIGSPTGAMYASQKVYWRNYTHGVTIVNPSSKSTFKVTLNASFSYVDLYGNAVGSTVVLSPHSGIVLLTSTRGHLHILHQVPL
ncbi:MAG TPA: putative glycoside hydrolase [Ktedonobacteraceae bacterium]|nr:putative glycoside hydrolase [Ktedonobacteraceae bacterium]